MSGRCRQRTVVQILRNGDGAAPIERICEAAGVTRATFYRHFADRPTLHMAVLEYELAEMERMLAHPDTPPLAFLRALIDMIMVYDRYLMALPTLPEFAQSEASTAKILATIAPPLERAEALGLIRAAITPDDVLVACRMAGSDWRLDHGQSRGETLERRLSLILHGLGLTAPCADR
ncbi:TetR/AcrR family transcriptional regulator [Sphingomonas spermidinifaciens]|uniref:TetR/AcrR family transcriptional regulator n=1 Tax=Sphingomonas spermidinifaciens TaxID=1141889 RepID=UPI001596F259|nr:TetR/AcrR family transcriptional regulator [Sphingomonas spermidinifaciens]